MSNLLHHKVTVLPAPPYVPNAFYHVAPAARPNYVETYLANADGSAVRRQLIESDVQAMINAAMASASGSRVFWAADIASRDAIVDPAEGIEVYVVDASDDPEVASGWAKYIYFAAIGWDKTAEGESQDMVATWAAMTGGPASTPAQIDAAVANRHVHANATELGKVGEDDDGNFTYGGTQPFAPWASTDW